MPQVPLASSDSLALAAEVPLFAGSAPITTDRAVGAAATVLAARTVIALLNDTIVAWNPAAVNGSEIPVGILCEPLDTTAQPGSYAPYYTGGYFNEAALVWPAAIDTLAERRAAFSPTGTIKIGTVL